jgi:hypothetical protein
MANSTPSRFGANKGGADKRELFLKVFSGEVLTTFNTKTVMADKTRVRNIASGKSASFNAIGRTVAEYHTPGAEILGNAIQTDEKVITIDDKLIAHASISDVDEAMSHFEVRSEYSRQIGDALAQTYDRNLFSLAVKAARDTGAGGLGVGAVGQANAYSATLGAAPTVADTIAAIYAAAQKMDENNIPDSDRYVFVSPAVYWGIVTNDKILNKDFGGSNGVYSDGTVINVAGMKIVKTNNLAVDHTAATGTYPDYSSKYAVDASKTLALVMHPQALGTVKLMDLASEMEWDVRRQTTLMLSKMLVGHGVLRPECIYEIKKA